MIIAIDIETAGLDARKFVMASLVREDKYKRIYYDKRKLWEYILKLGYAESRRGRNLTIYSHNAQFDFYGYADLEDKNIKYFCLSPFIAEYNKDGKTIIKFLDSMGLFPKMSLKEVGRIIGLEKLEMPIEFKEGNIPSKEKLKEFEPYVLRDSEIILEGIKKIKEKMKRENVNVKKIYTIGQIAINRFLNKIKKEEKYKHLFEERRFGRLYKTKLFYQIHEAYRGGRVDCFQTGKFDKITYVDCNNLYGTMSIQMKFPDLRTENKIRQPLRFYDLEDIISKIGISRVMIKNIKDDLGLLPVRMGETGNYFPKSGKIIIGTYTHEELREAIEEGYEIIDIEWSITWEESINPFKEITPELYKLRKETKEPFDNWYYKEMQNRCYGKFGQRKEGYEIITDSVAKAQEYLEREYEIIKGIGYNYQYQRSKNERLKKFYAPIIPTIINAMGRIYMYRHFKRIKKEDLIYTDTDSCSYRGNYDSVFKIGERLGEFKKEHERVDGYYIGKKTYLIGDLIRISGFRKKDITKEQFEEGNIKSKKMVSIKSGRKITDVGGFEEEERNLKEQMQEFKDLQVLLGKEKVYIDSSIKNINYFITRLVSLGIPDKEVLPAEMEINCQE